MAIRCIICDYDLHGLELGGKCPECGNAIARSVQGDLLRFADQEWLRRLEHGARLITTGLLTMVASYGAVLLWLILMAIIQRYVFAGQSIASVFSWLMWLGLLCGVALVTRGLWLFSAIEPRFQAQSLIRPSIFRTLSVLTLPVIAIWLVAIVPNLLPEWLALSIMATGFVVVTTQMVMFCDVLVSLERRCTEQNAKRIELLLKYRKQGIGYAAAIVVFSVLYVVLSVSGPIALPLYLMPLGSVIPVWFATISFARGTGRRIAVELAHSENETVHAVRKASLES